MRMRTSATPLSSTSSSPVRADAGVPVAQPPRERGKVRVRQPPRVDHEEVVSQAVHLRKLQNRFLLSLCENRPYQTAGGAACAAAPPRKTCLSASPHGRPGRFAAAPGRAVKPAPIRRAAAPGASAAHDLEEHLVGIVAHRLLKPAVRLQEAPPLGRERRAAAALAAGRALEQREAQGRAPPPSARATPCCTPSPWTASPAGATAAGPPARAAAQGPGPKHFSSSERCAV